MKKVLILLLISFAGYSQQNFFNVPSSDITKAKHVFFQQQLNFICSGFQSSTTFCYGLGKNYEIGFNVIGVTVDYAASLNDNAGTFMVMNGQKKWDLSPAFSAALGGQIGLSSFADGGAYAYSNGVYKLENTKFVGGLYYTSDAYFGPESRGFNASGVLDKFGFQAGIERNLWKEKLLFQADYISGKHSLGEVVIGGAYFISKNVVLSAGYQIPTMGSKSQDAVVFEITYIPL